MVDILRKTDLSTDIVTQDELDSTISVIVDSLSNNINLKISAIADLISAETEKLDTISTEVSALAGIDFSSLSDFAKKSEISDFAFLSSLSDYATNDYLSGNYPTNSYLSDNYASNDYLSNNYASNDYLSDNYASLDYVSSTYTTTEYFDLIVGLITDELSNNVNPKISSIADLVSAETQKLDNLSTFSNTINDNLSNYTPLLDYNDLVSSHNTLTLSVLSIENMIGDVLSILQEINDTEGE